MEKQPNFTQQEWFAIALATVLMLAPLVPYAHGN
jgi:hypothetical protein